jgi:hypothetical protein
MHGDVQRTAKYPLRFTNYIVLDKNYVNPFGNHTFENAGLQMSLVCQGFEICLALRSLVSRSVHLFIIYYLISMVKTVQLQLQLETEDLSLAKLPS